MAKKAKRQAVKFGIEVSPPASAINTQVGGDHYKNMAMQPIVYILENDLNYVEARVTEYMARWRKKGGIEDLQKAQHLIQLAIEFYQNRGKLP